ncbi:unnamed protein product [Caretta caretta]
MDRGSHFFYALEKKRGAKKHITCLLAEDGTPLMDPVEMCGRARAFYASLFSLDPTDPKACRVLWEELPMVSMGNRDQLELPLTLAKFSEALCRMPTNKSPGIVGLPMEFYRVFWDVLGPDLVTVWAESLQSRGPCWKTWSTDQTYTIPGHSIFDNLYLVQDLLELGCRDGLSFTLLSLDQEKAFDRVDHGCLLGTLRAFGFRPQFVGFLRVLYASAECLVRLNWTLTKPVSFGQGVRQGCPLSGQLYALAIEPFLCLLCRRLTGLVLWEPELQLVLSAYADDMLPVGPGPRLLGAGGGLPGHLFGSLLRAGQLSQELWLGGRGLVAGKLPPTRASGHPVECGSDALPWHLPFCQTSFSAGELA